ncbi:Hypothetical protein CINCED_3A017315 [Cinara cedri]|uniref:Uncharacterized protein n=1 Tax=Cinara cedri TaxID=506608 RepID=A0A5E4NPU4_9HEMI|nr:Hypothetical protein CINCED_3A017315 [Cinara cedri]
MFGVPKKPRFLKSPEGSVPKLMFDLYKSLQQHEGSQDRKTISVSKIDVQSEQTHLITSAEFLVYQSSIKKNYSVTLYKVLILNSRKELEYVDWLIEWLWFKTVGVLILWIHSYPYSLPSENAEEKLPIELSSNINLLQIFPT